MKPAAATTRRRALRVLGLLPACALPGIGLAQSLPAEVAAELPGARMQGSGRLRFLGLRIYEARLWAPAVVAAADWARAPLALELQYARKLVGRLIAERSLDEMRRQGEIEPARAERWLARMTELFPDVADGDRITGVQRPGEATRVFFNGALKGEVRDAEFTRFFFGIWLSAQTSEPALRDALLGTKAGS
jgi:hypothetical protein